MKNASIRIQQATGGYIVAAEHDLGHPLKQYIATSHADLLGVVSNVARDYFGDELAPESPQAGDPDEDSAVIRELLNVWHEKYPDAAIDLRYADLRNADLRNANMEGAHMAGAKMRNANLRNANMEDAFMEGAKMRNANLRNAFMDGAKGLEGCDA